LAQVGRLNPQQAVREITVVIQYLVVSPLLLAVVGVAPVLVLLAVLAAEEEAVTLEALGLPDKEMQVALEVVVMRVAAAGALQRLVIVVPVLLVEMVALEQQAAYLALVLLMLVGAGARARVITAVQAAQAVAAHIQRQAL